MRKQKDEEMTPEEKDDKKTTEIIDMFESKAEAEPKVIMQKKSFFDELWAKEHPEEAAEIKQQEQE